MMPAPNASVFPEPVAELPSTSFPASMRGIFFCCISVGAVKPAFSTVASMPTEPECFELHCILWEK